jgi:hypothetical protein
MAKLDSAGWSPPEAIAEGEDGIAPAAGAADEEELDDAAAAGCSPDAGGCGSREQLTKAKHAISHHGQRNISLVLHAKADRISRIVRSRWTVLARTS